MQGYRRPASARNARPLTFVRNLGLWPNRGKDVAPRSVLAAGRRCGNPSRPARTPRLSFLRLLWYTQAYANEPAITTVSTAVRRRVRAVA